jgi:signal transduction histidine kinase
VQEQLNNIVKHANCKSINIVLSSTDRGLKVEITDDGKGFDTSLQRKGIGLSNIKSRTELYHGTMEVVSSPGEGCRIIIHFPWNESTSKSCFQRN